MKVDIEHFETTIGLIRKKTHYGVKLTVQFNEAELHTIKGKGLGDRILIERPPMSVLNSAPDSTDHLYIKNLISGKGDSHTFATPVEARSYEVEIKEVLPKLKEFIELNGDITEKKTSFEL